MKCDNFREKLKVYAITDRKWLNGRSLENAVEIVLKAGIKTIQLREKNLSDDELLKEAVSLKKISDKYDAIFIVNDNVEVAKKADASGVHIGQSDMGIIEARKILGSEKIIGVSVQTVDEAVLAEKNGADYLGVGSIFLTTSKDDAISVSIETLKSICNTVKIPVVAIGGINETNIDLLHNTGIAGVAMISGIWKVLGC